MDCGVCIGGDYDYDGSPEFHDSKIVKARREHNCLECRRTIPKGVLYERTAGKFDGEMYCDKVCMDCVNIREALACGEQVASGVLWDEINAVMPSITTACIAKVETASAKEYLLQRWQQWKGLAPPPVLEGARGSAG